MGRYPQRNQWLSDYSAHTLGGETPPLHTPRPWQKATTVPPPFAVHEAEWLSFSEASTEGEKSTGDFPGMGWGQRTL